LTKANASQSSQKYRQRVPTANMAPISQSITKIRQSQQQISKTNRSGTSERQPAYQTVAYSQEMFDTLSTQKYSTSNPNCNSTIAIRN